MVSIFDSNEFLHKPESSEEMVSIFDPNEFLRKPESSEEMNYLMFDSNESTREMESKSSQERMRLTVYSNASTFYAILRFEKEHIFQACENFKEARGHSERIIWAEIAQKMLSEQIVDIFVLIKKMCDSSWEPMADQRSWGPLADSTHPLHRYGPSRGLGNPSKSTNLSSGIVGSLGLERLIGNHVCKEHFLHSLYFEDQFDLNLPQSMCIRKAIEAYELLVKTMLDTPSRFARQRTSVDFRHFDIGEITLLVWKLYYDTIRTLLWLKKITNVEPDWVVLLDDYDLTKKKLKSIVHSNNLWFLTSHCGDGCVDVQMTMKPVVSESGSLVAMNFGDGCVDVQMTVKPVVSESGSCVAMKFGTLLIKPIAFGDPCDDLELVTQLNLTFAPLTSHPECVLLVEAEKGSPNSFYDVSMTKGATHSATAKMSAAPSSSISYATSNATTIKATTKIWTHSQLLSRDRFYVISSNFAPYQLVGKGGYNSGIYFWKLDDEAEKALPEYLEYLKKPKSGRKFFSSSKRIPLLKRLGLPWNELDRSVNFTCEDYPNSIKWYFNNELHRNVTMKWMVKLEIFLVKLNGKTRRAFFWSDSLEIPSTLINEEAGPSSNNVHGK